MNGLAARVAQGIRPQTITLLTTYQCTAACAECCFGCSPAETARMSLDTMVAAIDTAAEAFPSLRGVIFSGGECFLLGGDLMRAVAHAASQGLGSRCVTNAYWATSKRGIERHLRPLLEAGLGELNISTGDAHQEFVPWRRVATAAMAAAEAGILTLVTVEAKAGSRFTISDVYGDPILADFLMRSPARGRLMLTSSVWVDFRADARAGASGDQHRRASRTGCDNLFDTLVFSPDGNVLACCGLTAREIPEMDLGHARTPEDLRKAYSDQTQDFAKLWLWLDGPRQILSDLARADGLESLPAASHPCEACRMLFRSSQNRSALQRHYPSHVADVLFRLSVRSHLTASGAATSMASQAAVPAVHRLGGGAS